MILRRVVVLWLMLTPLTAAGQPASRVDDLRDKAVAEGSVEVKVTTRAVAAAPLTSRTQAQRVAIQFAQQKVLLELLPRGLVVGNEINMEPDGSFTMRVLPDGLGVLAANNDVAAIDAAATPTGAQR